MALNKTALKTAIENAFLAEKDSTDPPEQSINRIANAIANAVDSFVKSGTVTVQAGQLVTTPDTVNGTTTTTGTGSIT